MSTSDHRSLFNEIYASNRWKGGSGRGSFARNTSEYRRFLQDFLRANRIGSVLDVGCGDWQFSRLINWTGIDYTGVDVSELALQNSGKYGADKIRFLALNAVTDDLPQAELLIMKDVLQHWSNANILGFLPKLRQFPRILIVNSYYPANIESVNYDIQPGQFRPLDLTLEPFSIAGTYIYTYKTNRRFGALADGLYQAVGRDRPLSAYKEVRRILLIVHS